MVGDGRMIVTVGVTASRLMSRMTVMHGCPGVLMGLQSRGSSGQRGPRGEEHHGHESQNLPDEG